MNKNEAAEYLGVSSKTVQRYAAKGKLKVVYVQGEAMFDDEEVKALYEELKTPVHRAIIDNMDKAIPTLSMSVQPEISIEFLQDVHEIARSMRCDRLNKKMVLNLAEASEISGISKPRLRQAAKLGQLRAIKQGGWKVRPADLWLYIDAIFVVTGTVEGSASEQTRGRQATLSL
jgi:excisionase family DNA binding protein